MIGIPPFPAHEKTALCLDRAVNSVGWQSIFSYFYMYPFVNRRKGRPRKTPATQEQLQNNRIVELEMKVELLQNFLSECVRM